MSDFQFDLNLVLHLGIAERAITSFSNPGNMGEDKVDIDKMGLEEMEECRKKKQLELIRGIDKQITTNNHISELNKTLMKNEVLEIFNKEVTWFFAISVGTLLWILSNFDKFRLPDESMPYKNIYMLSIILVGISSILLAIVQGFSHVYQHKTIKKYDQYITNFEIYKHDLINCKEILNDPNWDVNKLVDFFNSSDTRCEGIEESLNEFLSPYKGLINMSFSESIIIPPIIFYILGVICISAYILFYMINYVK